MSLGKYQATDEQKENAVMVISKLLDFDKEPHAAAIMLSRIIDQRIPSVRSMYAGLLSDMEPGNAKIADIKMPRVLVDLLQIDLLQDRSLRELLLQKVYEKEPDNEIFFNKSSMQEGRNTSESDLFNAQRIPPSEIMTRPWKPGSASSLKFVRALGLPDIFAGIIPQAAQSAVEDVEGPVRLDDLRDFQISIRDQILDLLKHKSGKYNRGIVRLPPGSGKTRIVVEALVDFWKNQHNTQTKFLIWIAQTEELCEQAFQSFRQAWTANGEPEQKLRLFRFWGSQRVLPNLDEEGIIIAGIDKLYAGIMNNESSSEFQTGLEPLAKHTGAVIVDEAHTSITKKYANVFRDLGISFPSTDDKDIPLIGLTATPFRGYNKDDTRYLLKKYNFNILYPKGETFDDKIWRNWTCLKEELTRRRILSKAIHEVITTQRDFHVDFEDIALPENRLEFRYKLLDDIGNDFERNRIILSKLLELAENKRSILYFAPSVNNANIMSALLREKSVPNGVVISGTNWGIRQMYVRKFKEQTIRILCNYGVLTTGFDAPLIDAIMIARPTESPNLYEQMIGRGLRGPEFGGTEECLIMDLLDNIYIHKLASKEKFRDRSEDFWDSMNLTDHYTEANFADDTSLAFDS